MVTNELVKFRKAQRVSRKDFARIIGMDERLVRTYEETEISDETLEIFKQVYYNKNSMTGLATYKAPVVIPCMAHKGGTAKTTTAVNLTYQLAYKGYNVLLIDAEEQANASMTLGFEPEEVEGTSYDMLINEDDARKYIHKTSYDNISIICAKKKLNGLEGFLAGKDGYEQILKKCLEGVMEDNEYDFIIIDCPPTLGYTARMIMTAADRIIIPFVPDPYGLQSLPDYHAVQEEVKNNYNKKLKTLGFLLSNVDNRRVLPGKIMELVNQYYGDDIFQVVIHSDSAVATSQMMKVPLPVLDSSCRASKEFKQLASEVIVRCKELEVGD